MLRFLVLRLVQGVVVLFLVSVMGFGILHLLPGGPLSQFVLTPGLSQADLEIIARQMGLDAPLPVQYVRWLARLATGDLGMSYRDGEPVLAVIGSRLPATLELMGASLAITLVVGTLVGMLVAVRQGTVFDSLIGGGVAVALSIPTFWFGLIVIYFFSVRLGWIPPGNQYTIGDGSIPNMLHHLVGPAVVLSLTSTAVWSRYMRASMLEVIGQDYMRTARAKGLSERVVLARYGLKNASIPMITVAGLYFPSLVSGAVITETVFTWPGIGRLFIDSLEYRDYPVASGILMLSALAVLIGSTLADLLYAAVDPRIRQD